MWSSSSTSLSDTTNKFEDILRLLETEQHHSAKVGLWFQRDGGVSGEPYVTIKTKGGNCAIVREYNDEGWLDAECEITFGASKGRVDFKRALNHLTDEAVEETVSWFSIQDMGDGSLMIYLPADLVKTDCQRVWFFRTLNAYCHLKSADVRTLADRRRLEFLPVESALSKQEEVKLPLLVIEAGQLESTESGND